MPECTVRHLEARTCVPKAETRLSQLASELDQVTQPRRSRPEAVSASPWPSRALKRQNAQIVPNIANIGTVQALLRGKESAHGWV